MSETGGVALPDKSLLRVELTYRWEGPPLEVSFNLTEPWTVLFGSSGSGKSTILRAIQGFVRPASGLIAFRGVDLLDTGNRLFVPAHLRPVRSAGQAARLFATMTVGENVLYGAGPDGRRNMSDVLAIFRIQDLAGKNPYALSGGERQRVSVARAVVAAVTLPGALLLLDEPFSGLDLALRDALAVELRDWLKQRGTPVLSVTHDVGEAFLLDADVLRLDGGKIVDHGPVAQVLRVERDHLLRHLRASSD